MQVITKRIQYKYGETIKIKPIFDVHLGNYDCEIKKLKAYLNDRDESTYFFSGGDFFDSIITSDLKRYNKAFDASTGRCVIRR